jgi:hypothetical protein
MEVGPAGAFVYFASVWRETESPVNGSMLSALAALAGAAIGGLTSLLANWLSQQKRVRAQWLAPDKQNRLELYSEFIEAASTCYVDALQHDQPNFSLLVALYAKIGRMRVVSSSDVLSVAEGIGQTILDTYTQPDKSFSELRELVLSNSVDIFRKFSEVCRTEFDTLRAQQF